MPKRVRCRKSWTAALLLLMLASPAQAAPSVSVHFSPGTASEAVVGVIDGAEKSVRVAAFSFTSKPIAAALVRAARRGVEVRAVLDKSNDTARYSSATFLANNGIPVRISHRYPIMHSKFIIADGKTVETGSLNYSRQATKNHENIVVLRDMPEVAGKYLREFDRLWDESRAYPAP